MTPYALVVSLMLFGFIFMFLRERRINVIIRKEFIALDMGNFEIAESYEMDILTKDEKITNLERASTYYEGQIEERDAIIEHHAQHCHHIVETEIQRLMDVLKKHCEPTPTE